MQRELGQNIYTVNVVVGQTPDGDKETESATLPPGQWRRDLIIAALIRTRYSADDMEAIFNNVLADLTDRDARAAHKAMQQWRRRCKQWATELMQWAEENNVGQAEVEPDPTPAQPDTTIEAVDGVATLSAAVELAKEQATDLEDEQAVNLPDLFPLWAEQIGKPLHAGERYLYQGRLWKVLQDHTAQADWTPTVAASLFTEVVAEQQGGDEPEAGTLENPIPYSGNMELEEGKYYTQYDVVYLCTRSTGTPVYHDLSALVGLYVQVVE